MRSLTRKYQTYALCAALILGAAGNLARADEAPPATAPAGAPAAEASTNAPAAAAPAPAKDWGITIGQDYFSEYVFRGVTILDHSPIWMPSVVATYKALTAYYYGYYGHGSDVVPNNTWYEEADFAVDIHQVFFNDKLTATAGIYGYVYPDGVSGTDTYEFYGKLAWACYLNPYAVLNWDVDAFHTGDGAVGISHPYSLTEVCKLKEGQSLTVTPSAQLGIDFGYNSRATQSNIDWNDVLLGVNLTYGITPSFSIHAMYQFSIALNSVHDLGVGNESIFNLGLAYTF